MRPSKPLSVVALSLSLSGFAISDDAEPAKKGEPAIPAATTSPAADEAKSTIAETAVPVTAVSRFPADDLAIRKSGEDFCKAYRAGDSAAVAELFAEDAEYVDEHGDVFVGRQKIAELLTSVFADKPKCQLEVTIHSIRFISPGVAVEDGTTTMLDDDGLPSRSAQYSAVHVKSDGKWLTASVRDHVAAPQTANLEEQLGWLLGDWVDEADDSVVEFSCQPILNGKFLSREFTVKIAGNAELTGSQRICRDPLTGQLKTWTFDSEGGHGQGTWYHDGENWVLKTSGVSSNGSTISGTSVYSVINDHTITWQAVNTEVDGERLPDGEVFTLVRTPPTPSDNEKPVVSE